MLRQLPLVCIYTVNIQTKDDSTPTMKLFRLEIEVPNDPSKIYLVTGKGENQKVTVQVSSSHTCTHLYIRTSLIPNTLDTRGPWGLGEAPTALVPSVYS